jgi:hypothetical protein
MILRLFPAGSRHLPGGTHYGPDWQARWIRDRKVAHPEILNLYLARVAGEGLAAHRRGEQLFEVMSDESAFTAALDAIDLESREDAIAALEAFEERFKRAHVVPASRGLLNQLPVLPERDRGMFSYGPNVTVIRVVLRLMRKVEDEAATEAATTEILASVSTLSARLQLIEMVGHVEGVGHELVPDSVAGRFEAEWRDEVRRTLPAKLVTEPELLRLLAVTQRDAADGEASLDLADDVDLTHALLRGAFTYARSQSLDSRAVRREARLHWDTLIMLFGDEETLKARVDALRQSTVDIDDALLELFDKYATGWRPERFH